MNQLSGKLVNLVLSVEAGRGLDFVKHPLHVSGNYNGRILESDPICPDNHATFNTELIWEVEKKDMRKMRSSNQPLRVECISTDVHKRLERIGFILLSLRSAQVISLKDPRKILTFKWHKLIGCQTDKKKHHPELYLCLTIRDHQLKDSEEDLSANLDVPLLSGEALYEEPEKPLKYPMKYLEDGFIQVGEDDDEMESFSLNILLKEAANLDHLLPESLVFRQNSEKYQMTFSIFGVIIKTKPFYKNFHHVFALNEKVVVRTIAKEETLFDFFSTEAIAITLYNGHELLGTAQLDLGRVSFDEQLIRLFFQEKQEKKIKFEDEARPSLEVKSWIKRSTDMSFKCHTQSDEKLKKFTSSLSHPHTPGYGDQNDRCTLDKLDKSDFKAKTDYNLTETDAVNLSTTKSMDTVIKSVPLSPKQARRYDVTGKYVRYIVEVMLERIEWKVPPKEGIIIFKFLHPRASNCITIFTQTSSQVGIECQLKNISTKLSYISTFDHVKNILNSWPPKLVLTDQNEKLLSEEYEFDASKFFCNQYRTYSYTAELKQFRTLNPLATLQICLSLEEAEIREKTVDENLHLHPPLVDEILSIKELVDIEKWKKTQQELFDQNMQVFKESEVKRMEKMWADKRDLYEKKLELQLDKCKKLQQELQDKLNGIKTENYLIRRRNHANIIEDINRENYKKYITSDIQEVIAVLSKTQRDNEYLKKLVEDQRDKLKLMEKRTLCRGETLELLSQLKNLEVNFEEAKVAKQYFQEQWENTCCVTT